MRQDIVIRGTTKSGLVLLLPDEMDMQTVIGRLRAKLALSGRFFEGAEVTVLVGNRVLSEAEQEAIAAALSEANMSLRAVSQGGDPLTEVQNAMKAAEARLAAQSAAALQADCEPAMVVNRTLRSGQTIRHQGDVIVLGDVNPGAEVIAAGNIVVMGALRGVAHAGSTGNSAALVAASKLRPTQLRIAHVIGRAPDIQEDLQPIPEVARVRDGMIVVETSADSKR